MKTTPIQIRFSRWIARAIAAGAVFLLSTLMTAQAQQIRWGLTLTNINNPTPTIVVTNGDGSISITTSGGDTYGSPDSFTYAYQQVTGDFDIAVQIINVTATDPLGQDSPKGSLMVRASLDPGSYDYMINALPLAPSGRDGQIESIGRLDMAIDTDDLPGRGQIYGGDTTAFEYCTYPNVWLRIQRQGDKFMSYFATTNTTDYPAGASPLSTNGWQMLTVIPAGTNFAKTVYIGLSTVAHNTNNFETLTTVTSTYANYGPTGTPHSTPSNPALGLPVPLNQNPGPFPQTHVLGVNWDVSLPDNGLGYPSDIVQSNQGAPQQIVWNSGGFGSIARDEIANVNSESADGYSVARYQAGAFDFMLSPRDPVAALQNLGPYSNPLRERISVGDPTVPASQAWAPSPTHGFVMSTVRKNGQVWNDQSPFFYAAAYVQLDGIATGAGYDMIGGHFRGGQFYTRTTKLVTGPVTTGGPTSGNLQRCAVPISLAWFPYAQGWKAGYIDDSTVDLSNPGRAHWKHGDGWGLHSGTAVKGFAAKGGQGSYNSPTNIYQWVDVSGGGGVYSGLGILSLPGINSVSDGILLTVGNNENAGIRGPFANNAALPDGSGWYVAVRDIETSKADPTVYATTGSSDAGSSFSFLYVPWNADNLLAGYIRGTNGAVIHGAGNFSVSHLSTGRYALTIPGKTGTNGVLLLENSGYLAAQPSGMTNVVDTSFLSYEYGGTNSPANAFIIEARCVVPGGAEGVVTLRDADFNFVWVDFQNPVAPPGTVPPVLSIQKSGSNVVVSWTNGPGFILQTKSLLSPQRPWSNLGTANPQTIPIGAGASFFRVVSP